MPPKKKEYVKFGTTKIRIPKKMVGFDDKDKPHLYNTITPKRRLSYHDKKVALDISINNNTRTKINRVPYTTKLAKVVEQKKKRKTRKPRQPPAFQPPSPPPPFQPPRPPPPPAPRPDIRFQQPNIPVANVFFQSPPPPPLNSNPIEASSIINLALKSRLARQQVNSLRQDKFIAQNLTANIGRINVSTPSIYGLSFTEQRKEKSAASIINLALKSRLAKKEVDKLKRKQKYEQAVAAIGNPREMVNRQSPIATRTGYIDVYENERKKKLIQTEQQQQDYKDSLNRRKMRDRDRAATAIQRKFRNMQLFKEPILPPSTILPAETQPIISIKTPEEAAAVILKNFKAYKFNKKLNQIRNKKLQEKLLKEPTQSLSAPIDTTKIQDEQKQMDSLKKNFNDRRTKQDKEALKNQKDRQKEFPKSFKDQVSKDWYIKITTDEYEVYKENTYKLYDELEKTKKKPVNVKNQKKIYDLELEILLIGGEARFWKAEIKRAKDIKIK
jgi:hypothetical protein